MMDLNDLRVFLKVATLRSFSAAARALGLPKSSVSRSVTRLEAELRTRLFQRTTREVQLTDSGRVLMARCVDILQRVGDAIDYVGGLSAAPHGRLNITAGIGFGINVLSELLPGFIERFPSVNVCVDLTSRPIDLVAEGIDVAIRMGPMPNSQVVSRRLGSINRYLCAAQSYLKRRGSPRTLHDLGGYDTIEMPGNDGRPRVWTFTDSANQNARVETLPRITINDPVTIHRLVLNGAGIGCLSGYLCLPDFESKRLVHLFPEWTLPVVEVNVIFPSNRELSPAVRAFVDYIKKASKPGKLWQDGD